MSGVLPIELIRLPDRPSAADANSTLAVATPALLSLLLVVTLTLSWTLFHTLAELFSVIVAVLAAVVAWQTFPFSRNSFLTFTAAGLFWVGALDLAHVLHYEGLQVMIDSSHNHSIGYWIAGRFLQALTLLSAPLFLSRTITRERSFIGFCIVAVACASVLETESFPAMYIPGSGLTPLKIGSEYLIVGLLGAALLHLWSRRDLLDGRIFRLVALSLVITIVSELLFTLYRTPQEWPVAVGHILKLVAYWALFVGIVATTLTEPFRIMARGASTYDAVPDPTIVVDTAGAVRQTNQAARTLVGLGEAECIGRHCHTLFHPREVTLQECPVCHCIQGGEAAEGIELQFEGNIWHTITLSPIDSGDTTRGMVHVSRDITDLRREQEALRLSEARLAEAQRVGRIGSWEVDLTTLRANWSDECLRLYGYLPGQVDPGFPAFLARVHPDDRPLLVDAMEMARRGELPVFNIEHRLLYPDGTQRHVQERGRADLGIDGRPTRMIGATVDVTELRHAQEEVMRLNTDLERRVSARTAELQMANKELEAFSYSVSHDLRAPLRSIDGFSQLLVRNYGGELDPTAHDYLARVRNATVRMGRLIDDLLNLSRVIRSEFQQGPVDLSELAQQVLDELAEAEPQRQVDARVQPGLVARGDVRMLRIVLDNLLGNAWKFTGRTVGAQIEFGAEPHGEEVAYYVRDNGAGFDMTYAEKLFGAFQRLHTEEQFIGTGIGLATVQRIIRRHGGEVWAQGDVGHGATFHFTLGTDH